MRALPAPTTEKRDFWRSWGRSFSGIEVISSDQYAGATRDTAKRTAENLLNRFGNEIDGIFCPNESSTAGMLLALQDFRKAGKVSFVGFDCNETFIEALRRADLNGVVVQDPMKMGYLGVKTLVQHLQGEPVESRIDTGVTLVTAENLDDPQIQELIRPPWTTTSNSSVTPVLRLSNIRKRFGATAALAGVDLDLRLGEVHALIGENGAGKSTLMRVAAGAFPPDSGEMELAGEPYKPSSPRHARRQGIAFIHQELSLFPHLTVWENVLMGIETASWGWLDKESCRHRSAALLDNFQHPEIELDRPLLELSIGARQVVEICRALALEARIILMDEPTSSLQRSDVDPAV